jgi:hypothetical protein
MPKNKKKTKPEITARIMELGFKPVKPKNRVFFHWNSAPEPKVVNFEPKRFDNNDDDPEAA